MKTLSLLMFFTVSAVTLTARAETIYTTYYHTDLIGSVVGETDERGNALSRSTYQPYGARSQQSGDKKPSAIGYTGHYQDDQSALVASGSRFYDTEVGRFFSADPAPLKSDAPETFNRYQYANNNPLSFIDPDGREVVSTNPANNTTLALFINSRVPGHFAFDGNNKLKLVDNGEGVSGFSNYYQGRLVEMINSKSIVNLNITPETAIVTKIGGKLITNIAKLSERGEGSSNTFGKQYSNIAISGKPFYGARGMDGQPIADEPADILAHEFLGHAIPLLLKSDSGNAIINENKYRAEMNLPLRQLDPKHTEE